MGSRPLLLGHRGARKYAPENTPAAFDLALADGCDGFEFDVRYTSDSRCVVCHDPLYRRRRIRSRLFGDLNLPGAEQVIREYSPRAYLDVELKVPGDARPILAALRKASPERYVISSFLPEVLEAVRQRDADAPLGLICENLRQLKLWSSLPIRALMLQQKLVSQTLIDEAHAGGKQVFVWTVNRERRMRYFAELGVDGLISDDTQLLVRTLKQ